MKATCPMNGEGNKSQDRQGPLPRDMGQRGGVTTHQQLGVIPTGGPGQQNEPLASTLQPAVALRHRRARKRCLWQPDGTAQGPKVTMTSVSSHARFPKLLVPSDHWQLKAGINGGASPFTCMFSFSGATWAYRLRTHVQSEAEPQKCWNCTPSSGHLATDSRDKAPACYTGHWQGWRAPLQVPTSRHQPGQSGFSAISENRAP